MTPSFLIVDEDRNFREALAIALRLDGYDARVAARSEEACARLAVRRFTCCVVDVHLAGADSVFQAAGSARAIAVATGPYPELLAAAVARHPRAAMLAKPFRAIDLLRALEAPARGTEVAARPPP
jgi:ActR/RegA family two-component response regulator